VAYQFAVYLHKKNPSSWENNKLAGEDWLKGFRHRNKTLSLRSPEPTSLARAIAFNRVNVNKFFDNPEKLLERYPSCIHSIFNLDETGIKPVQKPCKILCAAGTKQVGKVVVAECGTTVTMCNCINAMGNALPPAYIFPRVNFKQHLLHGAPTGSLGMASKSGWMPAELFVPVLQHFVKHMNVSAENPAILVLDNHAPHISIEPIGVAREHGLVLLTLPPHCSHRMQPLDVAVHGPFKQFYASFADAWQISNPGQSMNISNVADLSGKAYYKAFTPENITSGFRAAGTCPYNRNVFDESIFMPAIVTGQNFNSADQNEGREEAVSSSANLQSETPVSVEGASECSDHQEP